MIAAKMTSMLGDVTGFQQRHHRYKNLSHLFDRIEGFPLNALYRLEILQHIKAIGRAPPPSPHTSVRVTICVYVQGLSQQALRDFLLLKSVY